MQWINATKVYEREGGREELFIYVYLATEFRRRALYLINARAISCSNGIREN